MEQKKNDGTILFEVTGTVIAGQKKAAALGYPTANIACAGSAAVASGIYAGEAVWNGVSYPAALYKEDGKDVLEAYLLDFSQDLYGQTLTLRARHKIRDVAKFPDTATLVAAIAADIDAIKKLCSQE
jgi:riboflavin kinase/FMN adenylyltransferase